ncbi:hypothetical protein H0H81_007866 [Sphagnurus paluster]|uniref:Uncharacterized protein n=1 Tax=Sphagnurus paluster TaxID=117069 RepID=A0A9P7GQJ7_9AGAR|nr:hypothetical protein H0H81_007866 [Sphagnurus paluster]
MPKNAFPSLRNDVLSVRAFPFALLSKPDIDWPSFLTTTSQFSPWNERIHQVLRAKSTLSTEEIEGISLEPMLVNAKKSRVSMSIMNATSKKRTSNKRHIRQKISSKIKIAINLIVTRGARVVESNGKRKLVMDELEAEKMIHGWISQAIFTIKYYSKLPNGGLD